MKHFRNLAATAAATVIGFAIVGSASAAVDYNSFGGTYTQNFDSLPNTPENASLGASPAGWINDTTTPGVGQFSILGWNIFHAAALAEGGADGHQRVRAGAGTSNTGSFWSYGASGSTERALGGLASNTLTAATGFQYFGVRLTNNTGQALTEFTVSYDGEQWRDGGAATPVTEALNFQYSLTAASIQDSPTYIADTNLNFTSPVAVNTGSGVAVDGNVAGKATIGPYTITGILWAPGTDLWLRWADQNISGNDHGLSIDNFSFAAVPEPSSLTLLGAAGLAALRRRRVK